MIQDLDSLSFYYRPSGHTRSGNHRALPDGTAGLDLNHISTHSLSLKGRPGVKEITLPALDKFKKMRITLRYSELSLILLTLTDI